MTFIC